MGMKQLLCKANSIIKWCSQAASVLDRISALEAQLPITVTTVSTTEDDSWLGLTIDETAAAGIISQQDGGAGAVIISVSTGTGVNGNGRIYEIVGSQHRTMGQVDAARHGDT
jgi:hypothetical protein